MPKFCANLSTLFNEHSFLDRFAAAAEAGFAAVECQFPYAESAEAIEHCLVANDLQLVLHNLPAGDWEAGERGIACLPERQNEFRYGVDKAIDYATRLNCKQLNVLAGLQPAGITQQDIEQTLLENLTYVASKLKPLGMRVLVEAINTQDVPGFFVNSTQQTLGLIAQLDDQYDNVFMQYDIYHMQIMEGNLTQTITDHLASIQHIQLADNPGRHEPGTGEINFPFLFQTLDKLGYQGWVGCEYFPRAETSHSLSWLEPYLSK